MKYLSLDIETTGLEEGAKIIEFACVPVNVKTKEILKDLSFHTYVQCPSFEELEPHLNDFVKKHNKELIQKAHEVGISLKELQDQLSAYLTSPEIVEFFEGKPPVILGKSLSALDIPLLKRDLGWDYFMKHFHHQVRDVSSIAGYMVDVGLLPPNCISSSQLAKKFLEKKDVDHTALGDSIDMGDIYIKLVYIKKEEG